jgi:subtilisin family serine protease
MRHLLSATPLLILLLLLPLQSAAARQDALDAHLRLRAFLHERATTPSAAFAADPFGMAAARPSAAVGERAVGVIVDASPAVVRAIENAGGTVRARIGDVATAVIPFAALPALAAAARRVEAALPLASPQPIHALPRRRPRTVPASPFDLGSVDRALGRVAASRDARYAAAGEAAAAASGVDRLRQLRDGSFVGLTGEGVLIGIFDSGLDLEHPDFRHADGRTRVVYAWDQVESGTPPGVVGPHNFDYGVECDAAAIDGGGCPMRDRHGHGTHVLGVAGGNGRGVPGGIYAGVAPNAGLLVVKGGDGSFTSDRLLDGVAYMAERATMLGRPLVVNLSVATLSGPHDGSTLFERALDELSARGRIIVSGAGNSGDNRNETPPFARQSLHAPGDVGDVGAPSIVHELVVPSYAPAPGSTNDAALLEMWYPGDVALAITIVTPGGSRIRGVPGDTTYAETDDGAVYIDNAAGGVSPQNGDNAVLIAIFDADAASPPRTGRWRIEVERVAGENAARYHLRLIGSSIQNPAQPITLAGGTTNTHLLSSPGTATRLVTAAAYTTRIAWPGPTGETETFPFLEPIGDLAHFSAPGPRRDGRLKPDLAAPGKLLLAPLSRDASLWDQLPWMIDQTGRYAALLGTSMAAPYVAGTIALLFERLPDLTPEEATALLRGSARRDAFTGRGYQTPPEAPPNIHWGAGKLDALAAVRTIGHPAGSVAIDAVAVPGTERVFAKAGARIDLLRFTLIANEVEPMELERLALDVEGRDAGARLELVVDGGPDDGRVALERAVRLDGPVLPLLIEPGPVVAAGETRAFRLRIVLSADVSHGAAFTVRYRPSSSRARGVFSGAVIDATGDDVVSATRRATLLADGRRWSISENPVRSDRLVIVLDDVPRRAAIYTLAGALVRDLTTEARNAPAAIEWPLDNRRGTAVTSGVYLLVIDFVGERVLEKLFVLRVR